MPKTVSKIFKQKEFLTSVCHVSVDVCGAFGVIRRPFFKMVKLYTEILVPIINSLRTCSLKANWLERMNNTYKD